MNLIIGKNGFIASQLHKIGTFKTTSSSKEDADFYLDLINPQSFDYSCISDSTKVIFLAAQSSPDQCDNNYDLAYQINVTGTKFFINQALSRGAKVLFLSSDVIYGNTTAIVNENSPTNPFGNYAKMKDAVEKEFEGEKNFKVFRLSYVLSKEDKYLSYLQDCINKQESAEVYHPFSRKVIYIEDVLDAIEAILEKWQSFDNQKFNICGEENISRKDIADFYNAEKNGSLLYTLIEPNEKFWEARPKDINITSIYIEKLLGKKPTKIQNAIHNIVQGEK